MNFRLRHGALRRWFWLLLLLISLSGERPSGAYVGGNYLALRLHFHCSPTLPPGDYAFGVDNQWVSSWGAGGFHWDGQNAAPALVSNGGPPITMLYDPPVVHLTVKTITDQVSYTRTDIPITPGPPPNGPTTVAVDIDVYAGVAAPDRGATRPQDRRVGGTLTNCPGMTGYSLHAMRASLCLTDSPLTYRPAFGPALAFTLSYNHRDLRSLVGESDISSFGPKWTSNWISYLSFSSDPTTDAAAQVTEAVAGGGTSALLGFDTVAQHFQTEASEGSTLYRVNNDRYEKRFADGSKVVFAKPDQPTYPRRLFLTQVSMPGEMPRR